MRNIVELTGAQFAEQANEVFRRQGILSQLTPAQRDRAKSLYAIIGAFFKPGDSWEEFEHSLGYNHNPDFDLNFHAWVAERFQAYRRKHPNCGTFKLQREYRKLADEYFKSHPILLLIDPDTDKVMGEVWANRRRCA